ncbi:MAG: hypothetical protein KAS97_12890, partial [Candidatus Aminicenantes bacterium]|nr:hypothetical protein [Candidatus Aminicenantes bacterium]
LEKRVRDARTIVRDINFDLKKYSECDNNQIRDELYDTIRKKLHQIHELPEVASVNNSFSFSNFLFAGIRKSEIPEWTHSIPEELLMDENNIYFVGIAKDRNLQIAKENSHQDAMNSAIDFFSSNVKSIMLTTPEQNQNVAKYSEFIVDSSKIFKTYFKFDQKSDSIVFYTLIKINKKIASIDTRLYKSQLEQIQLESSQKKFSEGSLLKQLDKRSENFESLYLKQLLRYKGFNPSDPNSFFRAVEEGNYHILELFIRSNPTLANIKNSESKTAAQLIMKNPNILPRNKEKLLILLKIDE